MAHGPVPQGRLYREVRSHVTTENEPNMKTIAKADMPSLTKVQSPIQAIVLIAVSIITVWTLYLVPSWPGTWKPISFCHCRWGDYRLCLWLTRWLGSRAVKIERALLAAFLICMPLVYVMGWFAARDHAASSWVWVELL